MDTTTQYQLAPHSGNLAAAFNSTTNTVTTGGVVTLKQALTTVPSQAYDLSFWLANPIQAPSDFNNVFSVSWNGVALALSSPSLTLAPITALNPNANTYIVTPNTGWFPVTVTGLAATGTSTNLEFSGRNSDYATLLDDVVVVPEPSTVIMLGAGMVLMGLRRNRRARAA